MSTSPVHPNNSTMLPEENRVPRRGRNRAAIWGAILVFAGLSTLVSSLNWYLGVPGYIFALLFAAGGLAFGFWFVREPQGNWWAAIPAGALFGLSGTIMVSDYAPNRMAFLAGGIFLGALSLGFWAVYAVRRDMWWAIIPGGALLSLAATAALGDSALGNGRDNLVGATFMVGLGITFLVVALARPSGERSRWWAFIPAGILMVLGVAIGIDNTAWLESFNVVAALAMVTGGGFLLYKALGNRDAA